MAIQVSKTTTPHKYVPYNQRGDEVKDPVVLTIRGLIPKESAALDDTLTRIYQDQSISINQGSYNYEVVRAALLSWTNVNDEKGKPLPIVLVGNLVADESLNLLPIDWVNEIANVIVAISKNPDEADLYLGNLVEESK